MKKYCIKKYVISFCLVLVLAISVMLSVYFIKDNNSNNNLADNEIEVLDEDVILTKTTEADMIVDYSNIQNLVKDSDIIAIAKINSSKGLNYNPVSGKYVPVYTTGTLNIENIISKNSDVSINVNDNIDYVRLGGKIEYSEYLKGLTEAERTKLEQNLFTKSLMTAEQISKKLVKDFYMNDIEVESQKQYLVFLKYSKDYQKYNILGFEYGLREYDSTTMQIKNNVTNSFEDLNDISNKIINVKR